MLSIPMDERTISDTQVFSAFDLELPELSKVRSALQSHNLSLAKQELIHYFETRVKPHYLFDYRKLPLTQIDTNNQPYSFQASLGLSGDLKEFCLYSGRKMMDHIYVRPGRDRVEIDLGANYENLIHFNFLEDQGKKHRANLDMFVRGQLFEYLSVLYHETGDPKVLGQFEEMLQVFFNHYPLVLEYDKPDASRFSLTEDRDVMSVGWLILEYISLFYTRMPYEINPELAFEIIKRIWFLGIQFRRFDTDTYRKYNHHMWERGLVPFMLGTLLPEIPDFAAMKDHGASVVCQHIKDDFNEHGGYSEHSIPYWSGAALGEMLCRGIYLAKMNNESLLDPDSQKRIDLSFNVLALISPPHEHYSSLGDNGGPLVNPLLMLGAQTSDNEYCKEILALRQNIPSASSISPPLDYCNDRSGFVCARSHFYTDAHYMLMSAKINCGDSGHNHMDMLSMFISFRGQEFIGEPHSRQLYHAIRMGSDHRGYMYNMESHNTVLAYGQPVQPNETYADKWGVYRPDSPVSHFITQKEGMCVRAYHDAYTYCRHERTVFFHRTNGFLIHDDIKHGNRLPNAHIQRWNLMPDVQCQKLDHRSILLQKNGVKVLCLWTGEPTLHIWQRDSLCPEIVKDPAALSTIIDASFHSDDVKKADIASVSQDVLMLDVTDYLPSIEEYASLLRSVSEILKESDLDTALNKFLQMDLSNNQ